MIDEMTPINIKRWLDICNSQRDDKYDICPLCGENDSVQHAYCECKKIRKYAMSMHQSFDVRLSVEKREQAVSELLNINDIRKQAVQDKKIINFCSECIIDMTRDTTIADRNSLIEDVRRNWFWIY